MPHTFLVTGASSGMGASISLAALKAGHKVIATARNIASAKAANPGISSLGGIWLTLDVTSPDTQSRVSKYVQDHNVDVLINNAGFGLRGVLEDLSMDQIRAQMETNVFGAIACTKGAVPHFRAKRNGCIVNISSASGFSGNPGYSLYAASKFALEGLSESLSAELASFNIRVLVVELGGFRTNFQAVVVPAEGRGGEDEFVSEAYRGTIADDITRKITAGHYAQHGDPAKAAGVIVEVVSGSGRGKDLQRVFRLVLGKDAVQRVNAKIKAVADEVEKTKHIAESVSFD